MFLLGRKLQPLDSAFYSLFLPTGYRLSNYMPGARYLALDGAEMSQMVVMPVRWHWGLSPTRTSRRQLGWAGGVSGAYIWEVEHPKATIGLLLLFQSEISRYGTRTQDPAIHGAPLSPKRLEIRPF